jgi:hypothetical protein
VYLEAFEAYDGTMKAKHVVEAIIVILGWYVFDWGWWTLVAWMLCDLCFGAIALKRDLDQLLPQHVHIVHETATEVFVK